MERKTVKNTPIFVDTSAFKALADFDDEFHISAVNLWEEIEKQRLFLVTTNFILDETYTLLRSKKGRDLAVQFRKDFLSATHAISVERVSIKDEKMAWRYFTKLLGRGISFTDCTSFAVMKRLGLKETFTFDRDFAKAGFKVLP